MNEEDISILDESFIMVFDVIDFLKDILYTIRFPHYSKAIVFWLWFSITAPFSIVYSNEEDFI